MPQKKSELGILVIRRIIKTLVFVVFLSLSSVYLNDYKDKFKKDLMESFNKVNNTVNIKVIMYFGIILLLNSFINMAIDFSESFMKFNIKLTVRNHYLQKLLKSKISEIEKFHQPEKYVDKYYIKENAANKLFFEAFYNSPTALISMLTILYNIYGDYLKQSIDFVSVTALPLWSLTAIIILVISIIIRKNLRLTYNRQRLQTKELQASILNTTDAIKAYSSEKRVLCKYKKAIDKLHKLDIYYHMISECFRFIFRFFFIIPKFIIALGIYYKNVIFGDTNIRLSFGRIQRVNSKFLNLRMSFSYLFEYWNEMQLDSDKNNIYNDMNDDKNINDLKNSKVSILVVNKMDTMPSLLEDIKISIQIFRKNININVVGGSVNYIKSNDYALKNMILRSIMGISEYDSLVEIGGINIKSIPVEYYKKRISYLPPNQLLFAKSVLFNLAYGTGIKEDEVQNKIIELDRIIAMQCKNFGDDVVSLNSYFMAFHNGYHTEIGSESTGISSGQRQIVLFTRCILKDASIYIFDNPTVFLDYRMKKFVTDYISLLKNKTVIVGSIDADELLNLNSIRI